MALTQHLERPVLRVGRSLIAAAMVAIMAFSIVALTVIGTAGQRAPAIDGYVVSPQALASGRQWEIERRAQSGYSDPVLQSAREWEKQRRQQSPY